MELNKKNWLWMYYNLIYGKYAEDICSLSKGSLLIVLLSPIVLIGGIIDNKIGNYREWNTKTRNFLSSFGWGAIVYIAYTVLLIIGTVSYGNDYLGMEQVFVQEVYRILGPTIFFLLLPLYGVLMIILLAICVGIIVGIVAGTIWTCKKLAEKKSKANITIPYIQNTKDFIAAIKGKYCTPITWK